MSLTAGCGILFDRKKLELEIEARTPPELPLPAEVLKICELTTLPEEGAIDYGTLYTAYMARGHEIVLCDKKRQIAVDVARLEDEAVQKWLEDVKKRLKKRGL